MSCKSIAVAKAREKALSRGWNDMTHLSIKRFDSCTKLTAGARKSWRDTPYDVLVDYAPTSKATCKHCGTSISPKGSLRVVFMVQCHKGFKNKAMCHFECSWNYNGQMDKVTGLAEFHGLKKLSKEDQAKLQSRFAKHSSGAHAQTNMKSPEATTTVKRERSSFKNDLQSVLSTHPKGLLEPDLETAVKPLRGEAYSRASLRRAVKAGIRAGYLKQDRATKRVTSCDQ